MSGEGSVPGEPTKRHLRLEPTIVGRSRIKRLRGLDRPQYRLRVDEVRLFHDLEEGTVQVLRLAGRSGYS